MDSLTQILQAFAKPFQWWVVVAPWERGLRVRLGKVARDLAPGIHFRIPFLDRVHVQSIRLRTLSDSLLPCCSRDGQPFTVSLSIDFCISDLRLMFNSLSSPDVTLRFRAAGALARFASEHDKAEITAQAIQDVVNTDLSTFGCGIDNIHARVIGFSFARHLRLLMNEYAYGSGLHVDFDREPARNS